MATVEAWLQTGFSGDDQGQLARCVLQMDKLRRVLLRKVLRTTFGGTLRQQLPGYIPLLSYPICLRAGQG
jgi:hypothetical protein